MTLLRDLSLIWSLLHILVLFIFFYQSRYSRKKTILLSLIFMIPLGTLNVLGVIFYGPELMGKLLFLTCTIPSGILFFIISKHRNWEFLFTFSVVDTISYEIIVITKLLDYYLPGDNYITMFVTRLIAFPVLEFFAYKFLRKPYAELQSSVKNGWSIFTVVSIAYYLLLILTANFPTIITERPNYLPAIIVLLFLIPISYAAIFFTLRSQMKLVDTQRQEQVLQIQTSMLEQRIEQITELENKMKIQRHDMRHRHSILSTMLKEGKKKEVLEYLSSTDEVLNDFETRRYCENSAINAVFSYFRNKAENEGITVDSVLLIPSKFEYNTTELSVVFANVLENAINANLKLPQKERIIKCKCISSPQFMFQISNPFIGELKLDADGFPVTSEEGHGTGIRSIVAFCKKNDVYCEFKVNDGWFTFRMSNN